MRVPGSGRSQEIVVETASWGGGGGGGGNLRFLIPRTKPKKQNLNASSLSPNRARP